MFNSYVTNYQRVPYFLATSNASLLQSQVILLIAEDPSLQFWLLAQWFLQGRKLRHPGIVEFQLVLFNKQFVFEEFHGTSFCVFFSLWND